ncbi:MAG: mechanosensitive ion channel family protein [Mycobacteriales bacterium]
MAIHPAALSTGSLIAKPRCAENTDSFCHTVWDTTHQGWLARLADTVVGPLIHILVIIAVAAVVRWLLLRLIKRLVRTTAEGTVSPVLRPLRERGPLRDSPLVGRMAGVAAKLTERRRQRAQTIGSVLRSTVSFAIFVVAFILVLGQIGIDLRPIIASAGIAGIAIGFGAQNLVKDFLAGMFMILEDQYGVGDYVDLGQASGEVEAVGLRTTQIRDLTGTVWYVRNGEVVRVGNRAQGATDVTVDIRLQHHADAADAQAAISEVIDELWHDETYAASILAVPTVREVSLHGGNRRDASDAPDGDAVGLDLRVSFTCRSGDVRRVESAVRTRLAERFAADGIASSDLPAPAEPADPGAE